VALVDQVTLVGSVLRTGATVAAERVRAPEPPTTLEEVPISADNLTSEWLTAALCREHPGAAVTGFDLGGGSDGTSARRAVTVRYNAAGAEAGLPVDVYTKSSPRLTSRILIGLTGAAGAEALFYTSIRKHLNVGAPAGYYGTWDRRTNRSMVLIEDIAKTRGATFGNAATHVDRAAAESMVREMAAYHGQMWEDPRLDREWTELKDAETWQVGFNVKTRFDIGSIYGFGRAGEVIPAELRARKSEIWPAAMRSLGINVRGPQTLLHQDTHPANWFRLPDGTRGLYDWQGIAKGGWALDYSYAISAGLEVDDRRAWERDLLELYVEELARTGGPSLSFEQAWLQYRQQMFHGYIFWLYTIGVQRISPELQPDAHCRLIIGRISHAIVDLESIESLDS
jgi:hypothetical protein